MDGKALRGTRDGRDKSVHLLGAVDQQAGALLTPARRPLEEQQDNRLTTVKSPPTSPSMSI